VFATGRGEVFSPVLVDLSNYHITIINPGIHIPTPEAYAMISPQAGRQSPREIIQLPIQEWKEKLHNDFEKPIFEKYPEIQSLRDMLYEKGAVYAAMSGSGSSVFGIFDEMPSFDSSILNLVQGARCKGSFEGSTFAKATADAVSFKLF
jgi:4-diphosphocytidyl-2-C-methyl-D-erythritol kinase